MPKANLWIINYCMLEIIIFNAFAHEILPVDAVWSRSDVIHEELKDIFEENKHGFDS